MFCVCNEENYSSTIDSLNSHLKAIIKITRSTQYVFFNNNLKNFSGCEAIEKLISVDTRGKPCRT